MKQFTILLAVAMCLTGGSAQASPVGRASAGRLCEMFKADRRSFIVVVDEDLKILNSDFLDLGDIDFSGTRASSRKYFVVSSKNIHVDTSFGGEEMRASISEAETECAKVNVKTLEFNFDASSLPGGRFEQPLSIYRDNPSLPAMESRVRRVTGIVKRVWFATTVQQKAGAKLPTFIVRLVNSGNVASAPLSFELPSKPYIIVTRDGCNGRALTPSQSCELEAQIKFDQLRGPGEEFEVPILMEGLPYDDKLWFTLRDTTFDVFATNR
jgi:hypothetical protein